MSDFDPYRVFPATTKTKLFTYLVSGIVVYFRENFEGG